MSSAVPHLLERHSRNEPLSNAQGFLILKTQHTLFSLATGFRVGAVPELDAINSVRVLVLGQNIYGQPCAVLACHGVDELAAFHRITCSSATFSSSPIVHTSIQPRQQ